MKIAFLTGTRADYSKLKPYILFLLENRPEHEIHVFVTGMHFLPACGNTFKTVKEELSEKSKLFFDSSYHSESMTQGLSHITLSFEKFLLQNQIEFVFLNGDRVESFAGSIAAALNFIPICHIEAGDISGNLDESIRHATSKMAHCFFVADEHAQKTLIQLGENPHHIYITGNSSLAVNPTDELKTIHKKHHIPFSEYAILIYHPFSTKDEKLQKKTALSLMHAAEQSKHNFIVIDPNNDIGAEIVLDVYTSYRSHPHFCFFKSLPFEDFTILLRHAQFLIGNSSCGVKEAPYYHVPVIDISPRQGNRTAHLNFPHFYHCETNEIPTIIQKIATLPPKEDINDYMNQFNKRLNVIFTEEFWKISTQKEMRFI